MRAANFGAFCGHIGGVVVSVVSRRATIHFRDGERKRAILGHVCAMLGRCSGSCAGGRGHVCLGQVSDTVPLSVILSDSLNNGMKHRASILNPRVDVPLSPVVGGLSDAADG